MDEPLGAEKLNLCHEAWLHRILGQATAATLFRIRKNAPNSSFEVFGAFCAIHVIREITKKAYLAFSTISTRRQCLSADSGRVSAITTKSPMPASLFSS